MLNTYQVDDKQETKHWLAWCEMIRPQAARRLQCAVKWYRNLKP